jgi:hypothetical protein
LVALCIIASLKPYGKGKIIFVLKHHDMKTWGSGGKAGFLNLSTDWRYVVSFMLQQLYPWGRSSQYLFDGS